MDYINLGRSGLKVSRLCLGCMSFGSPDQGMHSWTVDEETSRSLIRQAVDGGINFFDTANAYSDGASEEILGQALQDFGRRDEVVIATKVYAPWRDAPNTGGLSRKAIFHAVDDSLRRLQTDYIDLYQIHRWDHQTPIEETLEALHDLVKAGKVRYLGASSMYAWQFAKALYTADQRGWNRFVSMQNHLNLLNREEEREMLPLCKDQGVAIIPWSPLAGGRLVRPKLEQSLRTQANRHNITKENLDAFDQQVIDAVTEVAHARAVSPAVVAHAWLQQKPGITSPIIGATKPNHLTDAIASLSLKLTTEEIAALEQHYMTRPVSGISFPLRADLNLSVRDGV